MLELQAGRITVSVQQGTHEKRSKQGVCYCGGIVHTGRALTWRARYIKELADRLNTLENQLPVRHPDLQQYAQMSQDGTSPRAMHEFSPPLDGDPSRKRTHSMSEGLQNPAYVQAQIQRSGERLPSIGDWPTPDAPRHLPHPGAALHIPQPSQSDTNHISSHYRSQVSPNGTAQSFWRYGQSDIGRRESVSMGFEPNDVRSSDQDQNNIILEWDDEIIDEYVIILVFEIFTVLTRGPRYYRIIHPTYPLLPNSTSRLRSRLLDCPVVLRSAFLEALYAAVRSSPASTLGQTRDTQGARKASELITNFQFQTLASQTKSINLIYLQTMILMVLEADNHATRRGQSGPPRAVWLGAAVGLSYTLKLHINPSRSRYALSDLDADENLGRRNWWILVILDRWHAVSTSSPLLIPDSSVIIMPEDQSLLGDSVFHLLRESYPYQTRLHNINVISRPLLHRRPSRRAFRGAGRPHGPNVSQRSLNQQTNRRRDGTIPRKRRLHPRLPAPRAPRLLAHPPAPEAPHPWRRAH